jgi:hypothetical protein
VTAGHTLEFVATFAPAADQQIGFGGGSDSVANGIFKHGPWAMFGTKDGTRLYARTNSSTSAGKSAMQDTELPGNLFNAPHRFRIDWSATDVKYWIDGVLVVRHLHTMPSAEPMRAAASDLNAGDGVVSIDWMRLTPFTAPCTFTSRVHNAGIAAAWTQLNAAITTPASTSVAFETRSGASSDPNDGTWSAWAVVTGNAIASPAAPYLQYRATLQSSDTAVTPSVDKVAVSAQLPPSEATATIVVSPPAP